VGAALADEASVRGAQLAGLFEALAHLRPRSMKPHFKVFAVDTEFLRHDFRRQPVESGALQ